MYRLCALVLAAASVAACDGMKTPFQPPPPEVCSGFGDWQTSEFVLPYPVGSSYFLNQSNCSGFGHSGFWKYGYDFTMPIGTLVTAARAGVVVFATGTAQDGDRQRTNLVLVEHDDGTIALYSHLTRGGPQVTIGQTVQAGDPVGLSGDTGNTGGLPHLHLSLHPCENLPGLPGGDDFSCPTLPFNVRNTEPNPTGPAAGREYEALAF